MEWLIGAWLVAVLWFLGRIDAHLANLNTNLVRTAELNTAVLLRIEYWIEEVVVRRPQQEEKRKRLEEERSTAEAQGIPFFSAP